MEVNKIALDPGEYKGTYKLIGGEICFDFTNTVSWRETDYPHEWLDSYENLTKWAKITKILSKLEANTLLWTLKNSPEKMEDQLAQIRNTRELLFTLFNKQILTGAVPQTTLKKLSILTQKAIHHQLLTASPAGYRWSWKKKMPLLDQLHYTVILSASDVLIRGDLSRIKKCPSCQWLYLDMSKNKSRRWCSMEDCGNRHKVNSFNRNQKLRKNVK